MREGSFDEAELERQLQSRGLMYRFFGRWMQSITREWQVYRSASYSAWALTPPAKSPCWPRPRCSRRSTCPSTRSCACPSCFTAGMTLMDTLDGVFMNFAYSGRSSTGPARSITTSPSRALGIDLLLHRTIEGARPAADGSGRPARRLLELHGRLRHQQGRIRDRRHVRRLLGRGV